MISKISKRRFLRIAFFLLLAWAWLGFFVFSPLDTAKKNHEFAGTDVLEERPKVFVIGLSKTGTTSVGDALARLSFQRLGWEDLRSRFLFRSYLEHNLKPLVALTQNYDAFEDLPWALVYQDMAHLYPDAKFILTLRKNEQNWLSSIKEHTARRKWIGHAIIYGASKAEGHESAYLDAYRNHTSSVRDFFAAEGTNSTRLLEFVIDANREVGGYEEELWGSLLRFLDMEDNDETRERLGQFPWSNHTDEWKFKYLQKSIWRFWDMCMYYIEWALFSILQCVSWLNYF
jgi:hypothetical protein